MASKRHCPKFNLTNTDVLKASTNGTITGTSVTFSCKEGHVLLGSPVLYCEESGKWNGSLPTCLSDKEITAETTTHGHRTLSKAEWQSETVIIILWSVGGALLLILLALLLCILQSHRKGRQAARLSRSNSIFHIHGNRDNSRQGGVNPGFSHSEEHWRWSFTDDLPPPPSYASLFEPAPDYETAITLGHAQTSHTVIPNQASSNGHSSTNSSDLTARRMNQRERLPTPVTDRRNEEVRNSDDNHIYQTIDNPEESIYDSVDNQTRENQNSRSVLIPPQTASVPNHVSHSQRTPIHTSSARTTRGHNSQPRPVTTSSRHSVPNRDSRQPASRHTNQHNRAQIHRTPVHHNFHRSAPIRHPVFGPQHMHRMADEPPPAYSTYSSPPTEIRRGRAGQNTRQSRAAPLMRLEYEYF